MIDNECSVGIKKKGEFTRDSFEKIKELGFKSRFQHVYVKKSFKWTFRSFACMGPFNWNSPPLSQIDHSGELCQKKAERGGNTNICFWQFTANPHPHRNRFKDLWMIPTSRHWHGNISFQNYLKIILSGGFVHLRRFILVIIAVNESYTLEDKILSSVWWLTGNYSGVDDRSIITLQIFISRKSSLNCFSYGMTSLPLLPLLRSIAIDIKFTV